LRRNATNDVLGVEIENVTCIRSGVRRHWLVLPTEEFLGVQCVSNTVGKCWLQLMLSGYNSGDHSNVVTNFFVECLSAFRRKEASDGCKPSAQEPGALADAVESTDSQRSVSAEPTSVDGSRKRGRAAIVSEADYSEPDEAKPTRRLKAKKETCPRVKRGEFVTLVARDIELTFTVSQGPRLLVPVEGSGIGAIINELQPRGGEAMAEFPVASTWSPSSLLTPEDRGRVAYRPATRATKAAFSVRYADKEGISRTSRAGLLLPSKDLSGDDLPGRDFKALAETTLKRARQEWNRLNREDSFKFS